MRETIITFCCLDAPLLAIIAVQRIFIVKKTRSLKRRIDSYHAALQSVSKHLSQVERTITTPRSIINEVKFRGAMERLQTEELRAL